MAKRPPKSRKKSQKQAEAEAEAEAEAATSRQLERVTGTENKKLQSYLFDQLIQSLWRPSGMDEEQKQDRMFAAIAALQGIKPRDEIEGMLGVQMVATHSAAMDCLGRAMLEDQTLEGRDLNLKHGTKLLTLYARQMETLDKHRGKGQQKMTIEYVNVEAGGQAIVGNVNTGKSAQAEGKPANSSAKAITHNPGDIIDLEPEKAPQKVKRKVRSKRQ